MITTLLGLVFGFVLALGHAAVETIPPLPELLVITEQPLTEAQAKTLGGIKPGAISTIVCRYNPEAVGKRPLSIQLSEDTKVLLSRYRQEAERISWSDGKESVGLSIRGLDVQGTIRLEGRRWEVIPLGGGLQAVSEVPYR